ncbi:MAG: hypothetical protein HYR88_09490 [Verrucomicrobia bacterium]|nr:hypothetical protein [Verrucomicrobiota bacterium]
MLALRPLLVSLLALVIGGIATGKADPVPPLFQTTAATTVSSDGRPWLYLAFGENQPGLIASRNLAVYLKAGAAETPNSFTLRGAVAPTLDATAITVLLSRGRAVGDDLGALEAEMVALHQWLLDKSRVPPSPPVTAPTLPLPQRIAAIVGRASADSSLAQLLDLMTFAHPALRMIRGKAWAGPLEVAVGAPVTAEVRERDAAGKDGSVLGRVTIIAGQRDSLPEPGPVVLVPDQGSSGDLSVNLRWATSDALRQAGARHQGDAVWRVARGFAEDRGFHITPPDAAALDALGLSNPSVVKRVASKVSPNPLFTSLTVADFGLDPRTSYITDNNNRFANGGQPFAEGSQYYYFVAAVDALGRPGRTSTGVLATFCRRVPPSIPSHLSVRARWSAAERKQVWDIAWNSNAKTDGTATTRYEVYRGNDLAQLSAAQHDTLDLGANPIVPANPWAIQKIADVPDPGSATIQTLLTTVPADGPPGAHWWFSARAIHQGPPGCPDVASPLSPPQMKSLPERSAPGAPDPDQIPAPVVQCLRVGCLADQQPGVEAPAEPFEGLALRYIARCAGREGIAAVRFHVVDTVDGSELVPETLIPLSADDPEGDVDWTLPVSSLGHLLDIQCRAESVGGVASAWTHSKATGVDPNGNQRRTYHFVAGAISQDELLARQGSGDPLWSAMLLEAAPPCADDVHHTVSPAGGQILHPQLTLPLASDSAQYRIYRRVKDGPITLIGQGIQFYAVAGSKVTFTDSSSTIFNGQVEYFGQLLDRHGNPSAMRRLGHVRFTGDKPPTPVLFKPLATAYGGDASAPTVTLTWICPPEHVDRFEMFFETAKPAMDRHLGITQAAGALRTITPSSSDILRRFKISTKEDPFTKRHAVTAQSFLTGRVGGDFEPGPRFNLPMQVDRTLKYTVWVRALGPNGEPGEISKTVEFQWQSPAPPITDIAWPMRPLPPVASYNHGINVVDFGDFSDDRRFWAFLQGGVAQVKLRSVDTNTTPVGIRVGSLGGITYEGARAGFTAAPNPVGPAFMAPSTSTAYGKADPNKQVFPHESDPTQSLFPCVLYRQQVPNDTFPNVTDDVAQCSPLVRSIAWMNLRSGGGPDLSVLIDPLFRWIGPDPNNPRLDLYLVDTQPVVSEARYRYWLVRFNIFGEPVQTIPCGEVTVR